VPWPRPKVGLGGCGDGAGRVFGKDQLGGHSTHTLDAGVEEQEAVSLEMAGIGPSL
jgi:hypothetical protein